MNPLLVNQLVADRLIVLAAGFPSDAVCKRMGVAVGVGQGIISHADYNHMLFIALRTLILTPQLGKAARVTRDE